ncbi:MULTISPECIES: response regulator transcription factor [Intrasporangiaceae]|uniref:Chemotaxis protein CheY n=1 Tax=Intrasporangium chromatireducens Q5-1 TaxID=584657 RepID=W9GIK2_9MICO|nr:response regulator transcription factor [Intrasporangium chromatireducens]EWT06046.1 chemotaxis protein CheY [Intrasporangium chromatireducens Q5-1]
MSPTWGSSGVPVVIVEDDAVIGRHLQQALESHGYHASWFRTGQRALEHLRTCPCEVMLLDLGLPDSDGVDIARQVRAEFSDLLIIMLTARTAEIDVIAGLDAGADDYLTKPFTATVLLARLRAHLRRHTTNDNAQPASTVLGALTLERSSRRVFVDGHELRLRAKEFDLLAALADQPDTAVSREKLMAQVWDENWYGSTKTLDVHIAHLRSVLFAAAANAGERMPTITTLRGHGYRLDAPPRTGSGDHQGRQPEPQ